jgi:hypothetical protein
MGKHNKYNVVPFIPNSKVKKVPLTSAYDTLKKADDLLGEIDSLLEKQKKKKGY